MQLALENTNPISRLTAAIPLAVIVTLAIMAMMEKLVWSDIEAPEDSTTVTFEDPVYVDKPIEIRASIEMVDKPVVEDTPDLPEPSEMEIDDAVSIAPFVDVAVNIGNNIGSIGFSGVPIAQFLVSPKYPNRAASRGLEGYVDVRFDVTELGTTENILVTGANPEGIFEKAALAAVKRWRYQPKTVDGSAVEYPGMTQRIVFQMEKG